MGTFGDLWGPLGTCVDLGAAHGSILAHTGTYDDLRGPLGAYRDLWRPMEIWDLWGPLGTFGDLWGPMGTFADLC